MRTRRTPRTLVVGCALAFVVAACGSSKNTSPTISTVGISTTSSVVATTVEPTPTTTPPVTAAPTPTATSTTIGPPTTTALPTTTAPPTTTTVAPGSKLALRFDGVGDARFATVPDDVVGYISGVLGTPTADSGWVAAVERRCPGTEVRSVAWGDLSLLFGDASNLTTGRRHFFAWSFGPTSGAAISPAGLHTPEGIGVGSTVAELRAAYPAATLFAGDDLTAASAQISEGMFAFLNESGDAGVVTALLGGQGCSK